MALFGKKANDAPSAPLSADDLAGTAGGPATLTTDEPSDAQDFGMAPGASSNGKRAKAVREPRASKGKTVKNGVAVGLNIGNQFIKAVEVTSKGGELAVTALGMVPTPPDSYSNGNVLSVAALSGAVRDLLRTAGIKSKVAITSVAGTGALVVRVIEVPKMSDGELKANMQVDADRYIPFPPSEVVMDFKALRELPSDPDAPNMEVLLAAAQREVIDLHVNVVQRAKLSPRAIDVEPIAAVRALQLERQGNHSFADYNEVTAVVNIGATGSEISILRGDVLIFTRAVPNGGNAVTQAISNGMGIAFDDAERLKIASADALAPAGYNVGDDFGFGGADDFDFGAAPTASTPLTDDFGAPAPAASDDPFDLDFFNSDTPKNEPGAGHAQKEDDEKPAPSPFDFDFAAPPSPPATPAISQTPPATPADSGSASAFDFAFSTPDAPPAPQTASAPAPEPASAFDFGFGDPDPDDVPSAVVLSQGTQPLSASASTSDPLLDDVFAAPASSGASQDDAPVTSAFDFDNLDLPAVQVGAPATPQTPVVAPQASAFSLTDPPASSIATPVPSIAVEEDAPAAPDASQFDLDSIFGTPAAAAAAIGSPVAASGLGALDATVITGKTSDVPLVATPTATPVTATADFGGTAEPSGFDDPAAGFGAPADDFASYGASVASTGSTPASNEASMLYSQIYGPLEELSNEVRRSLEFHLGRYPDATISRLVLMGGGAKLRNLDVFLTQMIGVPTVVVNPFAHIAVRSAKLSAGQATESGPVCAVALGLALRDFID